MDEMQVVYVLQSPWDEHECNRMLHIKPLSEREKGRGDELRKEGISVVLIDTNSDKFVQIDGAENDRKNTCPRVLS